MHSIYFYGYLYNKSSTFWSQQEWSSWLRPSWFPSFQISEYLPNIQNKCVTQIRLRLCRVSRRPLVTQSSGRFLSLCNKRIPFLVSHRARGRLQNLQSNWKTAELTRVVSGKEYFRLSGNLFSTTSAFPIKRSFLGRIFQGGQKQSWRHQLLPNPRESLTWNFYSTFEKLVSKNYLK